MSRRWALVGSYQMCLPLRRAILTEAKRMSVLASGGIPRISVTAIRRPLSTRTALTAAWCCSSEAGVVVTQFSVLASPRMHSNASWSSPAAGCCTNQVLQASLRRCWGWPVAAASSSRATPRGKGGTSCDKSRVRCPWCSPQL